MIESDAPAGVFFFFSFSADEGSGSVAALAAVSLTGAL